MNCRQYERHLPDWIAERLPIARAQQMQAHYALCTACQQATQDERALRVRWQELPPAPETAGLWARVAQRIESPAPQRRRPLYSVWSMGSAMAMIALLCVVLWPRLPVHPPGMPPSNVQPITATVDEHHIVQMVSEVQQLSDGENDTFITQTQQDRQVMSRLLRGKEEN